jgi:hypothetical protein
MKINFLKYFFIVVWFFLIAGNTIFAAPEDFDPSVTDSLRDVQIGLDGDLGLDAGDLQNALDDVAEVSSQDGIGLTGPDGEKLDLPKENLGELSKQLNVGDTVNSLKSETDSLKKESEGLTKELGDAKSDFDTSELEIEDQYDISASSNDFDLSSLRDVVSQTEFDAEGFSGKGTSFYKGSRKGASKIRKENRDLLQTAKASTLSSLLSGKSSLRKSSKRFQFDKGGGRRKGLKGVFSRRGGQKKSEGRFGGRKGNRVNAGGGLRRGFQRRNDQSRGQKRVSGGGSSNLSKKRSLLRRSGKNNFVSSRSRSSRAGRSNSFERSGARSKSARSRVKALNAALARKKKKNSKDEKDKKKLGAEGISDGEQKALDGTGVLGGKKGYSNSGETLSAQEVVNLEKKKLKEEFGEDQSGLAYQIAQDLKKRGLLTDDDPLRYKKIRLAILSESIKKLKKDLIKNNNNQSPILKALGLDYLKSRKFLDSLPPVENLALLKFADLSKTILGSYETAIWAYNAILQENPLDGQTNLEIGQVYEEIKNESYAGFHFRRAEYAFTANNQFEKATEAKNLIKRLEKGKKDSGVEVLASL